MSKKNNGINKIKSSFDTIFTKVEFKALITYERTRSDRNGSIFSILILDSSNKDSKSIRHIIEKARKIARSIDCIGWFDNSCIAILLPDTEKEGALVFRDKLLSELILISEIVSMEIYSYPENWLSNSSKPPIVKNFQTTMSTSIEQLFVMKMPLWKRVLDITGSLFLLLASSPVLILVMMYIKIISPGPVFFKQVRIGYKGIPFTFWKFRTMNCDNNESFHGNHSQSFIKNGDVPMEKLDDRDPRIFPGGRVLRKSCIDELPQLWNILKGDMSLVGPRPCIPYEAEEYLRWHTHRFDTVPGLSGLWQVSGKNKLTFKQMIRLDIAYCDNISFWGDVIIIIKTPLAISKMITESILNKINNEVEKTSLLQIKTSKRKVL